MRAVPTSPKKRRGQPRSAEADGLVDPPWSRVRRVQLIRREIRESVPPAAIELLLSGADHVVEGGTELEKPAPGSLPDLSRPGNPDRPRASGVARRRVYASLMTTIDLSGAAETFREPADAATAERVAELLRDDETLREKLIARMRPHLAELASMPGDALEISLDYEIRADGPRILIDADAAGIVS